MEGPTTHQYTATTCGLCSFHKQFMERSGLDPVYQHFCEHPTWLGDTDVIYNTRGRHLGRSDRTPYDCPYLVDRKAAEEAAKEASDG